MPGQLDAFDVERPPPDSELGVVLATLSGSDSDFSIKQAAVWIVTNDASFAGLGKLVWKTGNTSIRIIDPIATTAALRLLTEAGVDVRTRNVWKDRPMIFDELEPGKLRDWMAGMLQSE